MSVWAVVVGAGTGSRFGGRKQFELLRGRTVLERSLAAARAACDSVVAVLPASEIEHGRLPAGVEEADAVVAGGPTRSGSVRAGIRVVPAAAEVIVVHDAVRPLAGPELFERAVAAVREGADGAVPCVPVVDTLKRQVGGLLAETVDREGLLAAQTPQAFRAAALRSAHARGPEATDDANLVAAAGGKVVAVTGDPRNLKLTGSCDLALADALLGR
jgi:2-C-methyl-D-erythritol 4-phosphate cytidylyltransferase